VALKAIRNPVASRIRHGNMAPALPVDGTSNESNFALDATCHVVSLLMSGVSVLQVRTSVCVKRGAGGNSDLAFEFPLRCAVEGGAQ
jgi:hypothetical protein